MKTFKITEKSTLNSIRQGYKVQARDLTEAKKLATRAQMFQNTVLTIENERGILISYKENCKWVGE